MADSKDESQACKIFKKSSISALSSIASTKSRCRRIFWLMVLVLLTSGFLYQVGRFMQSVLRFPTVVSLEVKPPYSYVAPAYTFCTNNIISKKKFCAKYPDNCEAPDDAFCLTYPEYCIGNASQVKVVKTDILRNISSFITRVSQLMELRPSVEDFVFIRFNSEHLTPFLRPIVGDVVDDISKASQMFGAYLCYSVRDRINSHKDAMLNKPSRKTYGTGLQEKFLFSLPLDEVISPTIRTGVLFSVHSPFVAVNPDVHGVFLKPGKLYKISIELGEEILLPHPYETDCSNYTEIWEKNQRKGPRSQEMCKEKCMVEFVASVANCTLVRFLYPTKKKICLLEDMEIVVSEAERQEEELDNCLKNCKDDCIKLKFKVKVRERDFTHKWFEDDVSDNSEKISVIVDIDESEIESISFRPQYQQVEVFSYIGGFVGIWLGVSLVHLIDVAEALFLLAKHRFRNTRTTTS